VALAVGDLGIVTPVLTMLPRAHAAWEESAGIAEVDQVVRSADRLGFGFATCSEHVALEGLAAAGATRIAVRFVHRSPGHYLEQLEATATLVVP
jgi:hypothetical protein